MNDNLDELRHQWQRLTPASDALERTNRQLGERMAHAHVSSHQQLLARRIGRRSWLGILLPALAPLLVVALNMPVWFAVVYAVFGIAIGVAMQRLSRYIKEKNLAEMPVAEALERAVRIRLWQTRLRTVDVFCCLLLLLGFGVILCEHNPDMIPAVVIGAVCGFAYAIPTAIRNASLSRKMVEELREVKV